MLVFKNITNPDKTEKKGRHKITNLIRVVIITDATEAKKCNRFKSH
jgi:hypothetical protein